MSTGCLTKVCGITRAADAAIALHLGADYLGINTWSGSARYVPAERRASLLREIPATQRIAVTVGTTPDEARALLAEGFAAVQVHFDPTEADVDPAAISQAIGRERLWLAPRLADGSPFPAALLPLAETFVHDAHQAGTFGGTGLRSDWGRFLRLQAGHPAQRWILAGGLGPENLAEALAEGVRAVDLNSKVELAPGLKSAEKLHLAFYILRKNSQK